MTWISLIAVLVGTAWVSRIATHVLRGARPGIRREAAVMIGRGAPGWFALALGLALAGVDGCARAPEATPAPALPAVIVVPVVEQTVPVYGHYVGQTEAVKTVEIRARVEGFLAQQAVPDGARVRV